MPSSIRPYLVIYVVWHPDFSLGENIANSILSQFRRQLFENVAGGAGISVIFRSIPWHNSDVPLPIDFSEAESTAALSGENGLSR